VRHVGRHSERHTGSVIFARDVPHTKRGSRGGGRKENEQVFVTRSVILFVPVAEETMGAINKDGMDFLSDIGRRITRSTDDHRELFPLPATFHVNPMLQCSRCLGYLCPHNPEGKM